VLCCGNILTTSHFNSFFTRRQKWATWHALPGQSALRLWTCPHTAVRTTYMTSCCERTSARCTARGLTMKSSCTPPTSSRLRCGSRADCPRSSCGGKRKERRESIRLYSTAAI
jgi:hypothetical protein